MYENLDETKMKKLRVPFGPKEVVKDVDKAYPIPRINTLPDLKMGKKKVI